MANGNRIKALRAAAGIKQTDLGQRCGVGQGAISAWEVGRTDPPPKALQVMSELFNVSINYILGYDDNSGGASAPVAPDAVALTDDEMTLLDRYRRLDDEDKEILRVRALEMVREAGNTPTGAVKGA